jgi:transketolase
VSSNVEGHPTTDMPFVDVATGSLGQGLGVSCGLAYSLKYLEQRNNTVYCLMGDAEIQEGSVWEAANFASFYKLNNLVAFVDCNQFGQSNTLGHDKIQLDTYKKRFESFGWVAVVIDGHNMLEIIDALEK